MLTKGEKVDDLYSIKILEESHEGDESKILVGGMAVVYGGKDLQGDTFTADTDFWAEHASKTMPVLYDHGLGEVKNALGVVTKVEPTGVGVWMEAQIDRAKVYASEVLELIRLGKLGYSTGSVAHLVQRLEGQIKRWPIYELSLTPQPAEPRTLGVDFLKTLGLTVPEPEGNVADSIKGDQPKIEDLISDVNVSDNSVVIKMENVMPEEIKQDEEIVEEKAVEQPDFKSLFKSELRDALKEIKEERQTEEGGIITEAPAIKSFTKLGGDHDGGDAFTHWCRTGQDNYYTKSNLENPTKADLAEGADATGGVLVPQDLYSTIVAKRNESSVPHRAGAMVIQTSLDSVQVPSEDNSSAFTLTNEAGTYSTSDPSFTSNVVTVYKYTSTVQASEELLADQVANLDSFLADGWGRGLAQAYNQATLVDDGSSKPKGVCESATAGVSFASATAITAAELVELYHSVPDYYSEGSVWVMRNATLGALRALTGNPFSFIPTPQGSAPYGDLYGKRVLLSDKMAAPTTGNISVVVGNWSFYALVERASLEVFRDPYSSASTGQVNFYCKARFGGLTIIPDAFRKGTQA